MQPPGVLSSDSRFFEHRAGFTGVRILKYHRFSFNIEYISIVHRSECLESSALARRRKEVRRSRVSSSQRTSCWHRHLDSTTPDLKPLLCSMTRTPDGNRSGCSNQKSNPPACGFRVFKYRRELLRTVADADTYWTEEPHISCNQDAGYHEDGNCLRHCRMTCSGPTDLR